MDSTALKKYISVKHSIIYKTRLQQNIAGGNRIRAIASGSFEGTASLLKVDLTGNVCIDGAFSETELEDALTTECKLQPHVTRADALFDWSCGSSFRESALISHIISGNLRGGSPGYW